MAYESIPDPLAAFDEETIALEAGTKDPVTGIRIPLEKANKAKTREEEMKRRSQVAKQVLLPLMQQELGREWIYELLSICNVFGTPYTNDTHLTAYNSGALIIGRTLENELKKYAPQEYFMMLQEGWEREQLWNDNVADKS